MTLIRHLLFWVLVMGLLVLYFGDSGSYYYAFYFVTFLMPVAIGTSYFFNDYLVPKYLLTGEYLLFGLYFFYTLIVSFYLEILVMTLSLVVLANYQYNQMNPLSTNLFNLSFIIYLIVFIGAFTRMVRQLQSKSDSYQSLLRAKADLEQEVILVRANRSNRQLFLNSIQYIESLADYVRIHLDNDEVISKEKISSLQNRLPAYFIRTHRSFLVNSQKISQFNREQVHVGTTEIPIGRTYKKEAIALLESARNP